MNIQRNNFNAQKVAFSGHKKFQDKTGVRKHSFYYLYDPAKYTCELELYNIKKDNKYNYSIKESENPAVVFPMESGKPQDISLPEQINSEDGFAYRFKLTEIKNPQNVSYAFDNGFVIGIFDKNNSENKYNLVLNNNAIINKNGIMQLIMPDGYNTDDKPSVDESMKYQALAKVRTHANKLGGNFDGIIKKLPKIEKEGVSRIVGTPFTKDTISSHKYWTENAYQISPDFGTEEDYNKLQQELFKHGINWVSDAALVNEGLQGIHMSELLRKGSESYSKNMFRTDGKISLGILPNECDYTRMKVINAPFALSKEYKYEDVNEKYNPDKPTYIQFYDDRLVSDEQRNAKTPFSTYDKKNTDNIYEITKHDDAVYPFSLEVNPYELQRNFKRVAKTQNNKVDLSDIETIKKVTDFSTFNVVNKSDAGGLELWDGNVDIAKLNFYRNSKDDFRFTNLPASEKQETIADFDRGTLAVRDYAVNSGKYWTKLTADTQFEYVSSKLGKSDNKSAADYKKAIQKLVENHDFPSSLKNIDEETIQNVLDDNYILRRLDDADMRADINPEGYGNDYKVSDYILRQAMDLPLETLPVASNLLGIITSPYIAKKANTEEELGVSRYDLTKADNPNLPKKYAKVYSKADNLYKNKITPLIFDILKDIPNISDDDGNVTEYGKYVISDAAPEITKYILLKSVSPNSKPLFKNGHIDFSSINPQDITMQSLGVPYSGKTSEEEAQIVIDKMTASVSNLSNDKEIAALKKMMQEKFSKITLNDFKVAEMIMDVTESGLGWRIDAAKDIASMDAVRSKSEDIEKEWNNVIDFWKLFNQSVLEINPHSYTTAEITDLDQLFKGVESTVFTSDADAERKFLQETGITAVANYNYFFSLLPDLFCTTYPFSGIDNPGCWMGKDSKNFFLRKKLDTGWENNPGFLFQSSEDGIINSYTFVGNHDKPRLLHTLSLDMNLFYSDFSKQENKKIAAQVLQKDENEIDFDEVSGKAIAMGARLKSAFEKTYSDLENDDKKKIVVSDETKDKIKKAIATLAAGEYCGEKFDPDAFGTKPFEIAIESVLKQAEFETKEIPNSKEIEAKTLENILTPAFDRFYSIYKLLVVLPGSPTDFAGDKIGSSGYETKAKNYHQQNRNAINWKWLQNDADYNFIKTFYDNMNKISNLRKREELSALNDGATVTLPIQDLNNDGKLVFNENLQAFLRYNDKGSVVFILTDNSGANVKIDETMSRQETKTSTSGENIYNQVILNHDTNNAKQGLKHGLQVGTEFKNANDKDKSTYKIVKIQKDNKEYYALKRYDSKGEEIPVTINGKFSEENDAKENEAQYQDYNTLILYKI